MVKKWCSCVRSFGQGNKFSNRSHNVIDHIVLRHVDWAITTPLILFDLALLAGLPWLDIVSLLIADEAMILSSLFTVLHRGRSAWVLLMIMMSFSKSSFRFSGKWVWFIISWAFLIYVIFKVLWHGRRCTFSSLRYHGNAKSADIFKKVRSCSQATYIACTPNLRYTPPSYG
jgi:bacteriorhodopsin